MADSSTQHGRDFEHIVLRMVSMSDMSKLLRTAHSLVRLRRHSSRDGDDDTQQTIEAETVLMDILHEGLGRHRHCPLLVLASGKTSLEDKFYICMRAMYMMAGTNFKTLVQFCKSIVGNTTDFGVEFGINRIQPVNLQELFPWHDDPVQQPACTNPLNPENDFIEVEAPEIHKASLISSLPVAGPLHWIHNAANGLLDVMPSLSAAVDAMDEVCKAFSDKMTTCSLNKVIQYFKEIGNCLLTCHICFAICH